MNNTAVKKTKGILALILAAAILFLGGLQTSALAKPLAEVNSNTINRSALSKSEIYAGESVKITAKSKMIDASKAYYAYCYKEYYGNKWKTLSDYSKKTSYTWKPDSDGKYSVCVKIYSATKIVYRKYMTLTVRKKLLNHSLVSSIYAEPNQSVTLSGQASGGVAPYTYAFYNRKKGEKKWTTVSNFGKATEISMSPSETGEYDLKITVKDKKGKTTDKNFTLSVNKLKVSSARYDLTVQAPMSAPYQWTGTVTDHTVLSVSKPEAVDTDVLNAMTTLRYQITALQAGTTTLTLKYTAYSGKVYEMKYAVTVDDKLNFSVTSSEGNYFVKQIPQPEVYGREFTIKVRNYEDTYDWKCVSTSPYVIQTAGSYDDDGFKVYRFNSIRSGNGTIHFSYISNKGDDVKYEFMLNLAVDKDLQTEAESSYGYYITGYDLPSVNMVE